MYFQEANLNSEQMDSAPVMQSYDTAAQWSDFSLFENQQTFINRGESFKPILSAETFPVSHNIGQCET